MNDVQSVVPRSFPSLPRRKGSVERTVTGLLIISTIEVVLLLRGFSAEMQHFVSGLVVLGVIALGAVQERTS